MNQQEENNQLVQSFLKRTFLKAWSNPESDHLENFKNLEFQINPQCNLACKYCYIHRYGDKLYPPEIQSKDEILKNLDIFLSWLDRNEYQPRKLDIFSGEPLIQDVSYQALDIILDHVKNWEHKPKIVIPTNFTFILADKLTEKVQAYMEKSREVEAPIFLSASFDGKYCEANRPFQSGDKEPRDDEYYNKAFKFAKKWKTGFHPMIYSNLIEDWKKNFLWFQEKLKKHDIPWYNIYLLEVRNEEWTVADIKKFGDFVRFLIQWSFKKCDQDYDAFVNFLFEEGFNILKTPLTTVGRGLGCSIQSTVQLRLGDLAWIPCHRTSYKPFIYGYFRVEDGEVHGFKAENPELLTTIYSFDAKNQPQCETCPLASVCSFGCLGAQYETNGDLFSPIPTVCQLEHQKILAMAEVFKKIGVYSRIMERIRDSKTKAFEYIINSN